MKLVGRAANAQSSTRSLHRRLAIAPTISYYAATEPRAVWDAGNATALFVALFFLSIFSGNRE